MGSGVGLGQKLQSGGHGTLAMASENTRVRLSSEFWAIIGSAVAIGALMLTVSGWHRSDIQSIRERIVGVEEKLHAEMGSLRGNLGSLESSLRGEMANLETDLRAEIKALDDGLSARIDRLQEGQALISARLAVVESHVLGESSVSQVGADADPWL